MKNLLFIIGLVLSCQILLSQSSTIYQDSIQMSKYDIPWWNTMPFMPGGPPFDNTIIIDSSKWNADTLHWDYDIHFARPIKFAKISHFLLKYPEGTLDLKVNFDTSKVYNWNVDFQKIEYRKEDLVITGDTVAIILYILKEWKAEMDEFNLFIKKLNEILDE